MANIFNEYFSSVFTDENLANIPAVDNSAVNNKNCYLEDIVINKSKITRALIKMNKAAGIDGINSVAHRSGFLSLASRADVIGDWFTLTSKRFRV